MSETKWTKGPWRAERPDMMTVVDGFDSKWIYGADDEYVAVASGRDVETWEDIMANAHLIAAAPEMYEALNNLIAVAENGLKHYEHDSILYGCAEHLLTKAQDALKKARGEQQ